MRFHQFPQKLFLSLNVVRPGLKGKTEWRSVGQAKWLQGWSLARMLQAPRALCPILRPPPSATREVLRLTLLLSQDLEKITF